MADYVEMAYSLRHGYLKQYRKRAEDVAYLIDRIIPHMRKLLKLPDNIKFQVRPIARRAENGRYNHSLNLVEVDPRYNSLGTIMETIMHELVHAEQFHTERLKNYGRNFIWMNSSNYVGIGKDYEEYRARPWEMEAFDRQADLAMAIAFMIADNVNAPLTPELKAKRDEAMAKVTILPKDSEDHLADAVAKIENYRLEKSAADTSWWKSDVDASGKITVHI